MRLCRKPAGRALDDRVAPTIVNSKAEILNRAGCHVTNAAGCSASVPEVNAHLTVTFTRDGERYSKALAASVQGRFLAAERERGDRTGSGGGIHFEGVPHR